MACKKCGACCKWIYVEFPWGITLRELDILRGMEKVTDKIVRAPVMCKLFDPNTNLCTEQDTKPEICKMFPEGNVYIPKECRYKEEESHDE